MRAFLYAVGAAASVRFASIGDWGGAAVGGYRQTNEKQVAAQLKKTAAEKNIQFVLNTGDNFYFCGVKSLDDDAFKTVFEDVFDDEALYVPWYGCFGNHDYAYDVKPQTQYKSPNKDRWQIPAPYYSKRIALSDTQHMTLIVLDTSPCFQAYIDTDPSQWDPCSPEYANECLSPSGTCDFHKHVVAADSCEKQAAWLKQQLAAVPEGDWIITMGHNPAYEIDVTDLTSLLISKPIHLYLNGHVHELSQYSFEANANVGFITTGAGCMVHTSDQDTKGLGEGAHSFAFQQKRSGFTLHTFSEDFSTLTTDFVDEDGNTLHSFTVRKDGHTPPAPSPGPAPGPSGASCQAYGCHYSHAHKCQCNSECKQHGDCCPDFTKVCGNAPSPSPAPKPKREASCKQYGCGKYNPRNTCQCNSSCEYHKDCCDDYDTLCSSGAVTLV